MPAGRVQPVESPESAGRRRWLGSDRALDSPQQDTPWTVGPPQQDTSRTVGSA
ncbi:hypothetical protein [Streptomyces sp. YIM S03343]